MYNIQQHILEIEELGAFLFKLEDLVAQAQSTVLMFLRHTRTKYSKNTYYLLDNIFEQHFDSSEMNPTEFLVWRDSNKIERLMRKHDRSPSDYGITNRNTRGHQNHSPRPRDRRRHLPPRPPPPPSIQTPNRSMYILKKHL